LGEVAAMTLSGPRLIAFAAAAVLMGSAAQAADAQAPLDTLIARYAQRHGIPEHLLRRLIAKESGTNPGAFNRRYYGLMQITYMAARGMGYRGAPRGLLDPEINLTYGVPYLANAYRLADGDEARALQLYSSGYYYVAKRRHMLDMMRTADSPPLDVPQTAKATAQ
jgi:soluble lytic murein transglycosylase-like protein